MNLLQADYVQYGSLGAILIICAGFVQYVVRRDRDLKDFSLKVIEVLTKNTEALTKMSILLENQIQEDRSTLARIEKKLS